MNWNASYVSIGNKIKIQNVNKCFDIKLKKNESKH
jgi:hypothetical protein